MNYEPSEIYVKSKDETKKVTFAAEVKVLGLPETQKQDNTNPPEAPESIEEEKSINDDTDASGESVSEKMEDVESADE
jgi:hypothetical protein